jgi:hypothetical protein
MDSVGADRRSGFRILGFGVDASSHRRAHRHLPLRYARGLRAVRGHRWAAHSGGDEGGYVRTRTGYPAPSDGAVPPAAHKKGEPTSRSNGRIGRLMFCGMCLGDTTFIGILAILPPALAFAAGFRTYVRAKQIEQELAPARQVQLGALPGRERPHYAH